MKAEKITLVSLENLPKSHAGKIAEALATFSNGNVCVVSIQDRKQNSWDKSTKTRVYASCYEQNSETLLDNLANRRNRPKGLYRTFLAAVAEAVTQLESDKPWDITFQKPYWSQFAGCTMCPCSPGFIVEKHYDRNIWFSVYESLETYLASMESRRQTEIKYKRDSLAKQIEKIDKQLEELTATRAELSNELTATQLGFAS